MVTTDLETLRTSLGVTKAKANSEEYQARSQLIAKIHMVKPGQQPRRL